MASAVFLPFCGGGAAVAGLGEAPQASARNIEAMASAHFCPGLNLFIQTPGFQREGVLEHYIPPGVFRWNGKI
jgi:hypothetical protein